MVSDSIRRFLRKIHTDFIQNRIGAGKKVFFENQLEEIAFRYVPGEVGKIGKYYAKRFGRQEFEVMFDSSSLMMGIMEGRVISRGRYERYHQIEGSYSNRELRRVPYQKAGLAGNYAEYFLGSENNLKTGS
jgi:hypothetical protein